MKTASFEQREWIDPWRDRRPMTGDMVLATIWRDGRYVVDTAWYCCDAEAPTALVASLWRVGWRANGTVVAWKPLEEPYNPVDEVE